MNMVSLHIYLSYLISSSIPSMFLKIFSKYSFTPFINIFLRYRGVQTIWYYVLYTEWVLFLNLIYTHYTTSGQPIHHQTEVWWFNCRLNYLFFILSSFVYFNLKNIKCKGSIAIFKKYLKRYHCFI
jgi:hypothetical protein